MKSVICLAALVCWGLIACAGPESTNEVPHRIHGRALPPSTALRTQTAPRLPTSPAKVEAASIYDLDVALRDETGTTRPLDTFRGHPVLITMFYGTCPVACPILTSQLKRLEGRIPEPLRADVRILMVSFDAARDAPAALSGIKEQRGLDATRWKLASASDDDARQLAGVLNIKYRKLDDGAFFHSTAIVLLDRQGRPQARLDGVDKDSSAIMTALTVPSI